MFFFSISLHWFDHKFNKFFPWVESVLPVLVTGERSLPVLISTLENFVLFSLPCPAEEGSDRAAWWAPGSHQNWSRLQTLPLITRGQISTDTYSSYSSMWCCLLPKWQLIEEVLSLQKKSWGKQNEKKNLWGDLLLLVTVIILIFKMQHTKPPWFWLVLSSKGSKAAVPEQPMVPTLLILSQVPIKSLQFLCCTLLFPESDGTGNGYCWDNSKTAGVLCISLSGFLNFSAEVQFSTSQNWTENKNNHIACDLSFDWNSFLIYVPLIESLYRSLQEK